MQSHVSSKNPLLRLSRATCLRRLDCYTCIDFGLHFTIMLQSSTVRGHFNDVIVQNIKLKLTEASNVGLKN